LSKVILSNYIDLKNNYQHWSKYQCDYEFNLIMAEKVGDLEPEPGLHCPEHYHLAPAHLHQVRVARRLVLLVERHLPAKATRVKPGGVYREYPHSGGGEMEPFKKQGGK